MMIFTNKSTTSAMGPQMNNPLQRIMLPSEMVNCVELEALNRRGIVAGRLWMISKLINRVMKPLTSVRIKRNSLETNNQIKPTKTKGMR
jgi:hypothetical protein